MIIKQKLERIELLIPKLVERKYYYDLDRKIEGNSYNKEVNDK
jgi:hypothetical protein